MHQRFRQLLPLAIAVVGMLISLLLAGVSRHLSEWTPGEDAPEILQSLRRHDPFERLELVTYDWRARRAAVDNAQFSPGLGLVALDDASIDSLLYGDLIGRKVGPMWPRFVYGLLLNELRQQGAEAVAFDILLGDDRPDHGFVPIEGYTNVTSDEYFAEALRESGMAILAAFTNLPPIFPFRRAAWQLGEAGSPKDIDGSARRVDAFVDYHLLHPTIESQARRQGLRILGVGSNAVELSSLETEKTIYWPIQADGSVRVLLAKGAMKVDSPFVPKRVWHMGIVLAARRLGLDLDHADVQPGYIRLTSTNGHGVRVLPVMADNRFPVNWSVTVTNVEKFPSQGLIGVLADGVRRQWLTNEPPSTRWTNTLVIVGSTATGNNIADRGSTPLAEVDFLPSTYLNVADSVLRGQFVRPASAGWTYLIVGSLSLLASWSTWKLRPAGAGLALVALGLLWVTVADQGYQQFRWWLPIAHPLLSGMTLNYALMLTYRGVFEQRERQRVRGIFSKIVSPYVVKELLRADTIGLGGSRKKLTVFFADVRGFTELTDRAQSAAEEHVKAAGLQGAAAEAYYERQSEEVLQTVNLYLATIADVVKRHRGTLDKYIGDCVMAFWGAPTPNPSHAVDAVCAAVEAQRAMHRLNQEREVESRRRDAENVKRAAAGQPLLPLLPQLSLGSGINTGYMTVGLMGSDSHILNYTVFGREVNLASRLEGVSGRGRIIIGETTYLELKERLPDLAARCLQLEPVAVKGFRQPVPVFEVPWKDLPENLIQSGTDTLTFTDTKGLKE